MRLLLDEDVPAKLRHHFGREFHVETVEYRRWKGLKNGELLSAAEGVFDILVTLDNNIPDQQNLARFNLAVAILRAGTNKLDELIELVPELERRLPELRPGEVIRVRPPPGTRPGFQGCHEDTKPSDSSRHYSYESIDSSDSERASARPARSLRRG